MSRILLVFAILIQVSLVHAEHPIDVERLAAEERYYDALLLFQRLPRRQVGGSTLIAAGQSAWALGVSEKAKQYYNLALKFEGLSNEDRARLYYQKSLVEFQDEKYREAALLARRAANYLKEPSPLRGLIHLISGEISHKLNSIADARGAYDQALGEVSSDVIPEVRFRLGQLNREIGDRQQALNHFRGLPLEHPRSAQAIRAMAEISLEIEDSTQAAFWLQKGRELYPANFLDSWVDYALIRAAIEGGDDDEIQERRNEALTKYPQSDGWVTLLDAAAEVYEWTVEKQIQ